MSHTIHYHRGDATQPVVPGPAIIAHICNDAGGWGAGFTGALSRRWLYPERAYRAWFCGRSHHSGFGLGQIQLVWVQAEWWVANLVAQHGYRTPSTPTPLDLDALAHCLARLHPEALSRRATIHMPRIGTGLAGGRWSQIAPLIEEALCARGTSVYVYDLTAVFSNQ